MTVDDDAPAASPGASAPIRLTCGNPGTATPASFSRFAFPFAYQLTPTSPPSRSPCFRRERLEPGEAAARFGYLTTETADVLFRRAGWFRLVDDSGQGEAPRRFQVPFLDRPGTYTVALAPPRLVLFELEGRSEPGVEPDLLATGFLLLDLCFHDPAAAPGLGELLELNELFRYWHQPFRRHAEHGSATGRSYTKVLADLPIGLGADAPTVGNPGTLDPYLDRWLAWLELPVSHHGTTYRLFPEAWRDTAREALSQPQTAVGPSWLAYADTRAFVWTCALVEGGLGSLPGPVGETGAAARGHWIKLLNVDPPGDTPEKTTRFERGWAAERTYTRWEDLGTAYGFTYHSGALLALPLDEPPLHLHFSEQYFDQVLLLLYVRVASFRFSRALSEMTGRARSARIGEEQRWWQDFGTLRREFAFFTNLYQFPLISNQQQGVELYTLAREQLDVEELFREIQAEVQSTHDYFEIEAARGQNTLTNRLTLTATVGLALGLVTGWFGMNIAVSSLRSLGKDLALIGLGLAVALALFWGVNRRPGLFSRLLGLPDTFTEPRSRRSP